MVRVLTVVGARPQFIKMAPVSAALEAAGIIETVVHTGQHFDDRMSGDIFAELAIRPPTHNLEVNARSHASMVGVMMERLEPIMVEEAPDMVLVYGDTNSTLAGTLVAARLCIPLAHVEAGLRSHNRAMPEEQNRIVADHLSDLLFAPTELAVANLSREGLADRDIRLVGDVMLDAALHFGRTADQVCNVAERFGAEKGRYALVTVHRAENTDNQGNLAGIIAGLSELAKRMPVFFPAHPRTVIALKQLGTDTGGIRILPPLTYLEMVAMEKDAAVIVTDSGGVQKEAFFHRVPCVTVRGETEWRELVDLGWNRLTQARKEDIVEAVTAALGSSGLIGAPYGDGLAAVAIADAIRGFVVD